MFERIYLKDITVRLTKTKGKHAKSIYLFSVTNLIHCVKSVRVWSFSGPYSVRMRENAVQKISEYGHFLRSDYVSEAIRFFY